MSRLAIAALLMAAGLVCGAAAPAYRWDLPRGVPPPPVPADNPMSKAKVELGRRLFYDADLSVDGTLSCAACHEQHRAFTEGNATHPGVKGAPGRRNVPGLANVGYLAPLTWADPAQTTLERQVATPVTGEHPVEMGMHGQEAEIVRRLAADACYREMFAAAFPETKGEISFAATAKLCSDPRAATAATAAPSSATDASTRSQRRGGTTRGSPRRAGERRIAACSARPACATSNSPAPTCTTGRPAQSPQRSWPMPWPPTRLPRTTPSRSKASCLA